MLYNRIKTVNKYISLDRTHFSPQNHIFQTLSDVFGGIYDMYSRYISPTLYNIYLQWRVYIYI